MNIIPKPLIRRTLTLPQLAKLSLLGLVSLSGQANAATSSFTDSASFFAALPGSSSSQDFEEIPALTVIPDGSTLDSIAYSSNLGVADLIVSNITDTISSDNYSGGDELSFGFSSLAQAFGLFVIGSPEDVMENDFLLAAGGSSVSNLASPEQTLSDGGEVFFLGLIDTDGFSSAQLLSFGDPDDPFFIFNVDDVSTVDAVVPEPSSHFQLNLGLLVLGKKWHSEKLDNFSPLQMHIL